MRAASMREVRAGWGPQLRAGWGPQLRAGRGPRYALRRWRALRLVAI